MTTSDPHPFGMGALAEAVADSAGRAAWLAGQGVAVRRQPVAPAASVGLHLLLIAGLLLFRPVAAPEARPPAAISVTMMTDSEYRQLTQPVPVPVAAPQAPASQAVEGVPGDGEAVAPADPQAAPAERLPGGPVRATQFYAGEVLNDAANHEVRTNFPLLATSEQAMQICNIEAIEQLKRFKPALAPDTVVSYAFADVAMQKGVLRADGGAVRGHRAWWHLSFDCTPAPDFRSVAAFAFTLGDRIPRDEWDAHALNADDDSGD